MRARCAAQTPPYVRLVSLTPGASVCLSRPSAAEYGVQIHIHSHGHESSIVRIENIEMWRAGQQGRKNRFPMFFHRIGYMRKSYVRQCAIHHSYNRGIVLDNVHGLRIQENVVYHAVGHTMFLQTGAEIANVFSNNLVAETLEFGLLNTELTPASFHLSNCRL